MNRPTVACQFFMDTNQPKTGVMTRLTEVSAESTDIGPPPRRLGGEAVQRVRKMLTITIFTGAQHKAFSGCQSE